jgi:hypothetical protein
MYSICIFWISRYFIVTSSLCIGVKLGLMLREELGPKRNDVTREWRKLHNEELHNLCSSPNIIRQIKSRRLRWVGHVAHMREEKKVYKVLVWKPEGNRPLWRPRHRWEDGVRMDLREIGLGVWIGFDRLRTGTGGGLLWVRWWTFGFLRHRIS